MPVSPADAQLVRDIVRQRAAISLDASKDYLIETRLESLIRSRGIASIEALVERARRGDLEVHTQIVEALTTHETSFFRDAQPFELLRTKLIPQMIARRLVRRTITIWSAACSSGQEPYSLAMMITKHFPELAHWRIRIIGTDLSAQVLDRARAATFTLHEVNRGLPAAMLVEYFERSGMNWTLKEPIRRLVELRQQNLLDISSLGFEPDIVLMRNVLIYFDPPVRRTILDNVRRQVARDGLLLLGAAESMTGIADGWDSIPEGPTSYFKVRP